MAKHITPEIMMTYMAVELMPSRERSAGLLEFLTKNAGVEYLAAIPALGDKLLSYGPFQLTKFVIHPGRERTITSGTDEHKKEQVVIEGQGDVTRLLSVIGRSDVLPDSLTEFSTIEEHIRAGYLFAFNNVLALVANAIEDKRYDDLTGIAESVTGGSVFGSSTVFPEFVSAAHHRPEVARKAFERWLDANKKRKPLSRDTSLQAFFPSTAAGQQVRTYAEKAKTISKVLRPYLR
jgi:hypothetical protein